MELYSTTLRWALCNSICNDTVVEKCQSTSLSPFFLFFLSFFLFIGKQKTNPKGWTKINNNGDNAYMVDPIPFTDTDKNFTVNITPKKIELLKDEAGVIRFHKVMEFCLPRFDDAETGQ